MENIQYNCQFYHEWTSQQIHSRSVHGEMTKSPRSKSQILQDSVSMSNVKIHYSMCGVFGSVASRKIIFSEKNVAAHLRFVKVNGYG